MKKTKTILMQVLIGLMPTIYLLSIWSKLPDLVPTHYNLENKADDFGSKVEVLSIILFMFAIAVGTSLLILNLDKFDPKKRYSSNNPLIVKISWTTTLFISMISCYIVYATANYTEAKEDNMSPKFIVALVALLFTVLGNFMNNIKPNYFVGIRTPWTLDNEDNWRMTHRLAAKIWFFGGLIMFVTVLFVPIDYVSYVIGLTLIPLVGIPVCYSFYIFKQKKN